MPRPTPFELVFGEIAEDHFPQIRAELDQGGHEHRDRDGFLMVREVVTLLRELRPDQGLGEGIHQLAALVHHAFLFWEAGRQTVDLSSNQLQTLLSSAPLDESQDPPTAHYVQFPERRVWAQVISNGPHEPLDGCFIDSSLEPGEIRVLGVFGVHPEREGFSVVEVAGPRPVGLAREDGAPLFDPVLPGGTAARLFSLTGQEELLELGWRVRAIPGGVSSDPEAETASGTGPWKV